MLCALALGAAACSSEAEDAADVVADGAAEESTTDAEAVEDDADPEAVEDEDETGSTDAGDDAVGAEDVGDLVDPGAQFAPVQIVGTSLEAMPPQIPVTEADNDPAIGELAPDVTGTSFDGTPVTITADGTPRVIMFVAHWCPHCQREIPAVKALIDEGAVPPGLEIVVVSTAVREGDPNFPPQDWLEGEQWPGPIMRDSTEFDALFAFGAGGFPFTVYLDSDHRVVARSAGELPEDIIRQIWLATADA